MSSKQRWRAMRNGVCRGFAIFLALGIGLLSGVAQAGEDSTSEVQQRLDRLESEVSRLRASLNNGQEAGGDGGEARRLVLGGYGEMHANFREGESGDQFDLHRLVAYVGYRFSDWLRLHSEIELEHAFVAEDGGGELSVEQAHLDMDLTDSLGLRFGRVLVPVGIINQRHEPPTFNGVERPSFSSVIVPSTWSGDGAGLYGRLGPALSGEVYVVGGLDGTGFSALNGIRGGRIKERPSLNEPAVTGRVDLFPLAFLEADEGRLRLGISAFCGGINNGNQGDDPGLGGSLSLYSADLEGGIGPLEFRGAIAHLDIAGAGEIGGGVAEGIFGWYAETGLHVWPEAWSSGSLADADAVVFVRYDDYDTQYEMPSGVAADPAGDRSEWTLGVSFSPVPNLVFKADYQLVEDAGSDSPDNRMNFGIGWKY